MESKKPFLPAVLWLLAVTFLLVASALIYYFLHKQYASNTFFWTEDSRLLTEVVWWSVFGAFTNLVISAISLVNDKAAVSARYLARQLLQVVSAPLLALILFALLYYPGMKEVFDRSFIVLSYTAGLLPGYLLLSFRHTDVAPQYAVASYYEPVPATQAAERSAGHAMDVMQAEPEYGLLAATTVTILPRLDDAGLFYDEKREVLKRGFGNASVSLQATEGGEIIVAERTMYGNQAQYLAENVEPGSYLLRAMLSVRMDDNSLLNLFGEETIIVRDEEVNVAVHLKKLEI